MRDIGVVVSYHQPPNHMEFFVHLYDDVDVKVGEYVEVPSGKYIIVGKITKIQSINELFTDPRFVKDHIMRKLPFDARIPTSMELWREAKVNILSVIEENTIHPPLIPPEPGDKVYKASEEVINRVIGINVERGILIGQMYGNERIKVYLDLEKLSALHFAIFGSTGSGKSYTVGVIVEEILEKKLPVIIFDPHGEYKSFDKPNFDDEEELRKLGLIPARYPMKVLKPAVNGSDGFTLSISDIDADIMAEMLNITPTMRDLLFLSMRRHSKPKDIDDLIQYIKETAEEWGFQRRTIISLIRNLLILKELNIFGEGISLENYIKKGVVTIIDLSEDMEERIRRALVGVLLAKIFKLRKRGLIPPLIVVIEESHRFAPQDEDTISKSMMRRIAREGRKFGVGLGIVSQRIVGLDKDVISQCGTKIILRVDSKTDLDYLRPYLSIVSEDELDSIPYLPRGVGIATGVAIGYPVMVKIRRRKTKHGADLLRGP